MHTPRLEDLKTRLEDPKMRLEDPFQAWKTLIRLWKRMIHAWTTSFSALEPVGRPVALSAPALYDSLMSNHDIAFQRAILENPADTTLKMVYADWLQDRSDPRAEYVRLQLTLPELEGDALKWNDRRKVNAEREKLAEVGRGLDPSWVAFMNTLAQPFEPITFQQGEPCHPFTEPVGQRGRVDTFTSQYRTPDAYNSGLRADLAFLTSVEWGTCAYGAMDFPLTGFVCERSSRRKNELFTSLKLADYPIGGAVMPDTIWVQTNFEYQHMFNHDELSADDGPHGLLKRYVTGPISYLLLHIGARPCVVVVLLAVGHSPHGHRYVGAITSQLCHNLCD